jgi:UDP-glucose/GDP-mannose dehydrogenase family, NAD binding domain
MSCFFANVARQIGSRLQRGSPRDCNRSGTATIREADTETARPGHQIIRLAVIFVHLFSHNMTSRNRRQTVVDEINLGKTTVPEPRLTELVANNVRVGRLRATTDFGVIADNDIVIVTVGTPRVRLPLHFAECAREVKC